MGEHVVVEPRDVTFPAEDEVKVTVHRIQARNNPIGTFFARILGFSEVDLSVDATAHVATPGDFEVDCLLPLTIQDLWREADGSIPDENDTFDEDDGDFYVPWSEDADSFTGYSEEHIGTEFVLKSNQGGGTYNPSWYGPWTSQDDTRGANWYRDRITGDECGAARGPGDVVDTEPGNMVGPTKQGFNELIGKDPGAQWNDAWTPECNCDPVTGGMGMNSPRIRPIPMFDPRSLPEPGRQVFTLSNFAGIFVEEVRGNDVIGRFMGIVGAKTGDSGEDNGAGPITKVIEIIE